MGYYCVFITNGEVRHQDLNHMLREFFLYALHNENVNVTVQYSYSNVVPLRTRTLRNELTTLRVPCRSCAFGIADVKYQWFMLLRSFECICFICVKCILRSFK